MKYAEYLPFYGCEMPSSQHLDAIRAETLFRLIFFVVHNIAYSAANHVRHLAHVLGKL